MKKRLSSEKNSNHVRLLLSIGSGREDYHGESGERIEQVAYRCGRTC